METTAWGISDSGVGLGWWCGHTRGSTGERERARGGADGGTGSTDRGAGEHSGRAGEHSGGVGAGAEGRADRAREAEQ